MNNIILIGMPASGKSSAGVILAKVLGYDFIDTDILLQRQEKHTLEEIILQRGLEEFLKKEEEVCVKLEAESTVIATGGSVIYEEEAMKHLGSLGKLVYLKVSAEELSARIGDMKHRGVVLKEGQTMEDLYKERTRLYEKWADLTIDECGLTLENTVKRISEAIKGNKMSL